MPRGGDTRNRRIGSAKKGSSRRGVQANGGSERVTRSSRAKLTNGLEDPAQVERELNAQLRSMGLYAANITGDGNCLFRALSDQMYGYPTQHIEIRQKVCDYLEARPERFAGFVEVEKTFDDYVRCMRQSGTYGGHLEISAFAHLTTKEIKVVQPGLVYVISGDDESPQAVKERERREKDPAKAEGGPSNAIDSRPTERTLRQLRRTSRKGDDGATDAAVSSSSSSGLATPSTSCIGASPIASASTESVNEVDRQTALASSMAASDITIRPNAQQSEGVGPLWIAYHSWEHYSSIRNIDGPHSGLPRINEKRANMNAHGKGADSRAAPQKAISLDSDEEDDDEPTEEEALVLRSTNGYSLQQVRFYIKRHGGWEEALEAILADEMVDDDKGGPQGDTHGENIKSTSTTRSSSVRSMAPLREESNGLSNSDHGQSMVTSPTRFSSRSPIIDHLRDWRAMSPSSVDTNGTHSSAEGASASTHATTDESPEASGGSSSKLAGDVRRSKRTASKDPMASLRTSKRRSRSRSPRQQSGDLSGTDAADIVAANAIANISVTGGEAHEYASSPLGRLMSDESGTDSASVDESAVFASRQLGGHTRATEVPSAAATMAVDDPDKTPRAKINATPKPATRTLTMRERREMRKADKVRRALDAKTKREQRARDAHDDDDDDDDDDEAGAASGRRSGFLKQKHAADVKGFLELKL